MEYEITPEPAPDERQAILEALERLLDADPRPPGYTSRWRETGLRENVEPERY